MRLASVAADAGLRSSERSRLRMGSSATLAEAGSSMTRRSTISNRLGLTNIFVKPQKEELRERVIRTESLETTSDDCRIVEHSEVAEVILATERAVPYDLFAELPRTGRIVLIDGEDVAGGGIITGGETAGF